MSFLLLYKKRYFAWKKKLIYKLVFIKTKLLSLLKKKKTERMRRQIKYWEEVHLPTHIISFWLQPFKQMKPDIEKQILHYTTYMWTLKKRNQTHLETADWWLSEVGVGVGKMSKGDQKIQTSSYKYVLGM